MDCLSIDWLFFDNNDIVLVKDVLEIISPIVAILALIYVGIQVRQGSKSLRTSTRNASFNSLMEWNYCLMSDPDLANIFYKGCLSIKNLDENELQRYFHTMYSFFKMFENIFLHFHTKSISSETWEYNRLKLEAYALQPGAQDYWEYRKDFFNPKYVKYFDAITEPEVLIIDIHNEWDSLRDPT